MNELTLIIPAKNESESLPIVLQKLKEVKCDIIVSLHPDDVSTISSIKDFNIEIIKQSKKGFGNALTDGINNCKTKYFCIFNADGSFEQNDLVKMYELNKNNDFVFASRYSKTGGSEDDTIITFVGNWFFSKLGQILYSLKIDDILYTFIMGKTESFKKLDINSNDFRFCVELPIKMHKKKLSYASIPSYEKKRIAGKKNVNEIKDGFLILLEMLRLFFFRN